MSPTSYRTAPPRVASLMVPLRYAGVSRFRGRHGMTQERRGARFEIIQPDGMYKTPSYVHAIRAGNTLYLAGQVARDEHGAVVGPDAAAQARRGYPNAGRGRAAAGARWTDVVKVTTYLVDRANSQAVSAVRFEHFGDHRPPHTGLLVAGLGRPELNAEPEAIPVLPE